MDKAAVAPTCGTIAAPPRSRICSIHFIRSRQEEQFKRAGNEGAEHFVVGAPKTQLMQPRLLLFELAPSVRMQPSAQIRHIIHGCELNVHHKPG